MVKKAGKGDAQALAALAAQMWKAYSVEELAAEFTETMTNPQAQFFLKYQENTPVGFAQGQLRSDYVEGTRTTPVGYLEGIFVREEYRGRGFAKQLLSACEAWAREMGCQEFASDCELENTVSFQFHKAMHFTEANRIICFTKKL